jgi:hypothetical protein
VTLLVDPPADDVLLALALELELEPQAARYSPALAVAPVVMNLRRV